MEKKKKKGVPWCAGREIETFFFKKGERNEKNKEIIITPIRVSLLCVCLFFMHTCARETHYVHVYRRMVRRGKTDGERER